MLCSFAPTTMMQSDVFPEDASIFVYLWTTCLFLQNAFVLLRGCWEGVSVWGWGDPQSLSFLSFIYNSDRQRVCCKMFHLIPIWPASNNYILCFNSHTSYPPTHTHLKLHNTISPSSKKIGLLTGLLVLLLKNKICSSHILDMRQFNLVYATCSALQM